jgi:hypothetical protein
MSSEYTEGFLTVLGYEFCDVLRTEAGIPDASGHDCYSALTDTLGKPVTFEVLNSLKPAQFAELAIGLNQYFETTTIRPAHVAKAVSGTIWRWR